LGCVENRLRDCRTQRPQVLHPRNFYLFHRVNVRDMTNDILVRGEVHRLERKAFSSGKDKPRHSRERWRLQRGAVIVINCIATVINDIIDVDQVVNFGRDIARRIIEVCGLGGRFRRPMQRPITIDAQGLGIFDSLVDDLEGTCI
jgi:hypothetical protein